MKLFTLKNVVVGMALLSGAMAVQAQVAVVVGSKSTATAMTAEQVASVFLGKSDQIPGVGTALPLDLPESNASRELFYSHVAGKSAAQVKAAWARLVFSGKASPPKEIANPTDVKKMLANNANAIGYIPKSEVDSSVKVLFSE